MQIFYMNSQLYIGWLMYVFIHSSQFSNTGRPINSQIDNLITQCSQQNNNFTYIYVENNNYISNNPVYKKRIYYKDILTA